MSTSQVKGRLSPNDPTIESLKTEVDELKSKTDNIKAEVDSVRKDVDEVKDKTKAIP